MKTLRYKAEELLTLSPDARKLRKYHKAHPREFRAWLAKNFDGVGVADFLNLPHHNNHRLAILKLKIKS